MQSWLLWNVIGLYPLTGSTTFLIGSPWFESLSINLGNGKKFTVKSKGGDGGSGKKIYVQSLTVNGVAWNKSWVEWKDVFEDGGVMEFVLGANPSNWTTGALPPSPAAGS
jgi:putative alpha-1,2-mannosidase